MDTSIIERHQRNIPPTDMAVLDRLRTFPGANLADAQNRLRVMDSAISTVWPRASCVGTAFTVLTRPGDNLAIHAALEETLPGDVIVVAGGADTQRALIGELIGGRARARGVAGFIIDGAVRDAAGLENYGIPVFARAITPAGPYKNGPGELLVPVSVGGVAVLPGDYVIADADGVVVVPRGNVTHVLERAEKVLHRENGERGVIENALQGQR